MAVIYESLLHREYPIHLLNIILPIGLSFHTFQSMSYTIEVYRGTQKAERNYHIFATYVMFYPQLVAGPIERPQNLIHQFYEKHTFNLQRVTNGLRLMTWGFFKKVVVADRLGLFVDQVYSAPFNHSGLSLLIATYFFAFQIYCDFSGYTDIARGTARVMGFELIPNFNLPYFARSVSEFWKRWHMSLSYWFRDYVYLPLGGNRVSLSRWTFNILVVFALSGIWHGANWTFLVWGLLNGLYIIVSKWSFSKQDPKKQSTHLKNSSVFIASVQVLFTFHLICVSWIFFRSSNIIDSIEILRRILTILNPFSNDELSLKVVNIFETQMGFALILGMVLIEYMTFKTKVGAFLQRQPIYLKGCTCVFVVIMILILGTFHSQKFIYFEF